MAPRSIKPLEDDIENRRPVWEALSDLFLDNELDSLQFEFIARQLAETDYSESDLEIILRNEVAAILYKNLSWVGGGGVWDAFDPDWLQSKILKFHRCGFWRRVWFYIKHPFFGFRTSMIREDWQASCIFVRVNGEPRMLISLSMWPRSLQPNTTGSRTTPKLFITNSQ